jgi:hypothetical protein
MAIGWPLTERPTLPISDPTLAAALCLQGKGFHVIPCHYAVLSASGTKLLCTCRHDNCQRSAGKHPALAWARYQTIQPSAALLTQWFTGYYCGYNLGVCHGQTSGTLALDWDGDEGFESRRLLELEIGPLPRTPTIFTGGGGEHQIFRHPDCHIQTEKNILPGFDVRADGGFSVAPPSVHQNSWPYVWDADNHVDDIPLSELPEMWIKILRIPVPTAVALPATIHRSGELITDGREAYMRNLVCRIFYHMAAVAVPTETELVQAVWDEYSRHADLTRPGRGEEEVRLKCRYILANYRKGRIQVLSKLAQAQKRILWKQIQQNNRLRNNG